MKRWFRYTHFLLKGLGEGAVRMEPDDAGLQPQTGAEPGGLRKIDGGGGFKQPGGDAALEKSGDKATYSRG